jgi:hypothetical protein
MHNDELKSLQLVVYALSVLGGAHKKVHTESVARKCLDLWPDRFRWELFDYPDKELVRKALFHASEKNNGSLVVGRSGIEQRGKSRDGWQLTAAGAAWVREHESVLEAAAPARSGMVPKREAERFLKQVRSQAAYKQFVGSGIGAPISPYMFTDMLNCSPDAPLETIRAKFNRILSMAELVNDQGILTFLKACENQLGRLLGRSVTPAKKV